MTGGVYELEIGGRVYIGGSANVERRIYSHLWHLRNGSHKCRALQAAFNAEGEAALVTRWPVEAADWRRAEQRAITEARRLGRPLYNRRSASIAPVTTPAEFAAALEAL